MLGYSPSLRITLLVVVLGVFAVCPVWGQTSDPSTLHIGPGAGTTCAMGCAGDPNLIGPPGNQVDVFQQSGGADALTQPLLLIIGIPNDQTALFSSNPIAAVTFINPYPNTGTSTVTTGSGTFAASGTFGMTRTLTNGFAGFETSSDVYTFLGFGAQMNNSNSIGNLAGCPTSGGNWTCTDLSKLGISATGFGIYVFALTGANLGPNGLANITFSRPLPLGTFVIGFGENISGTPYGTPFTEAGLVVPEPATLTLFGSGVIGLALAVRRRFRAF